MGRPKTVSDETLQTTARRCFLEHGPSLSINTIAAELGISDAAILKRVGSKEKLLRSCLSSGSPMPWLADIRSGPNPGALAPQLLEIMEQISATIKDRVPSLIAMRLSDLDMVELIGPDPDKAPPLVIRRVLTEWLTRAGTTHALTLTDPGAVAELLVSAAQARAFQNWISHGMLPEADWSDLVASVLDCHLNNDA